MKHVFIVGSHAQYLSSMGTIQFLKLNYEEVLFIWGRHYKCKYHDNQYNGFDMSDYYTIYIRNNSRKKTNKIILDIDLFINDKIVDNFTLYVPHLQSPFVQIFATNHQCVDIKFIQEGIIDFCSNNDERIFDLLLNYLVLRNKRIWVSSKWNTTFRLKGKNISETFAITNVLYRDIDCKHSIIKWPAYRLDLNLNIKYPFFLFESAVEMKLVEKNLFMNKTRKMIEKYAESDNYIKFHPFQAIENRKQILGYFHEIGKKVTILKDDVPFELIISSFENLTLYGFSTSLLFLGQLAGHHSTMFCESLMTSKRFRKYWTNFKERLNVYGSNKFNYRLI